MKDLVICEICGTSFYTEKSLEVCSLCLGIERIRIDKDIKTAQSLRKTAKSLGARALKGTPKQKKWGERLRLNFINSAINIEAVKTLISSPSLETAKFWIENRNNSSLEFDLSKILEITRNLNAGAGKEGDIEKRLELIKKLGFEN